MSIDHAQPAFYFGRTRNIWVSAYLGILIVAYALTVSVNMHAMYYLAEEMKILYPDMRPWVVPTQTMFAALNIGWAVALLRFKRWGFFGYVLTSVAICVIHVVAGQGVVDAALSLVAVGVLFLLLLVGQRSFWSQLE